MLVSHLAKYLYKVSRFKNIQSELSTNRIKHLLGLQAINMDRIEKILTTDKDLESKIRALRCEVIDVEAKIFDTILIERLKNENRELEEEIKKYKDELILLEKLNGRNQVVNSNINTNKGSINQLNGGELTNKVSIQSNESITSNIIAQDKKETISKKAKKDSTKKNEKGENTKGEKVDAKKTGSGVDELPIDIGKLDLKVGKIVQIEKHPDADSLYVEKVDIGKPELITVVSGLVKHISASELLNSLVIILCNLKPAKMRGVTSEGMVMCASSDSGVEVLRPPENSVPGEIVQCPGYNCHPDSVLNPKKKIFETVAPDLKTDDEMYATYKGTRWIVGNKGFVKAKSLKGVNIK